MLSLFKKKRKLTSEVSPVLEDVLNDFSRIVLKLEIKARDDEIYRLKEKIKDLRWLIKLLDNKEDINV